jgi:hypothetical protein
MAKVLNLDEIHVAEPRVLVMGGASHPIDELSVESYIEVESTADRLKGETRQGVVMKETVRLIKRQVPTVDESALLKLSLEKLFAVSEFVRGVDPEKIIARAKGAVVNGDKTEGAEPGKA